MQDADEYTSRNGIRYRQHAITIMADGRDVPPISSMKAVSLTGLIHLTPCMSMHAEYEL